MSKIDFLMVLPPAKPFPRPLDLTYPFYEKIEYQKKLNILPLQAGALRITTILNSEGYGVAYHDFCHFSGASTLRETVKSLIKKYDPAIIGGYSYTALMSGLRRIFTLAKEINPNIITIAGGPHVTFLDSESLIEFSGNLDIVVRGEGEKTIVELLPLLKSEKSIDGVRGITYYKNLSIKRNNARNLMSNDELSSLPLLDLSAIPKKELNRPIYFAMSVSRGCPYQCTFCINPRFWNGQLRFRPVDHVLEEVKMLEAHHDVLMDFGDTNLPIKLNIFEDLVKKFNKEQFRRVKIGMVLIRSNLCDDVRLSLTNNLIKDQYNAYVTIGIENSHESILKLMHKPSWDIQLSALKKIHQKRMRNVPSWMVGFPGEDLETMTHNFRTLNSLHDDNILDSAIVFIYVPIPGSPPFNNPEKYGIKILSRDWDLFDRAIYPPPYHLFNPKTGKITLTNKQIWSYYITMLEIIRRKRVEDGEEIKILEYLKLIEEKPQYINFNPVDGDVNFYEDFPTHLEY
ncbi:MAG: B12-binding domain-containing radical SAM protein [Candidatus Helarchaeota archaeon]